MEMRPQYAAAPSPKAQVVNWLRGFLRGNESFREKMQVGNTRVSKVDLLPTLAAFRAQLKLFEGFGSAWPVAHCRLVAKHPLDTFWVPLDVTDDSETIPDPHDPDARAWLAEQIARRSYEVQSFGLQVEPLATKSVFDSFVDRVSEVLITRTSTAAIDQGHGPPSAMFRVTTNSQGLTVVFAQGVFLSTAQGFGMSSPADRKMPWGFYMFGVEKHGKPDFSSQTVWQVPNVATVHLEV